MSAHFLASLGKESWHSPLLSRGGGFHLKVERNSRSCVTIPKDPNVPIQSRYTWFPCTDSTVTWSIDSQHDGTCDSPVAPWAKATNPYVNSTGRLTLLLQLERKADLHVSTRDEAWLPCGKSIGTPRSMSALERNRELPGSSPCGSRVIRSGDGVDVLGKSYLIGNIKRD